MAAENGDDNEKVLYKYDENVLKVRIPSNPIHPLILSRRSLRSMTGQPLSDEQLMVLFEAAHWAPSHFNGQLWRFVYAKRETEHWDAFFEALSEENQRWAQDASALVVVISRRKMLNPYSKEEELVKSHHFEAGAAWMAMALEGTSRGLVLHAVNGFDAQKARDAIGLTDDEDGDGGQYSVEVMIAIGVPDLYNAEWEEISLRREIGDFISEGTFVEKGETEEADDSDAVAEEETPGEEKAAAEELQNDDFQSTDRESETQVEEKEAIVEERAAQTTASVVDENSIELAIESAEEKENADSAPPEAVEKERKEEPADKEPADEPEEAEENESEMPPETELPETETPQ